MQNKKIVVIISFVVVVSLVSFWLVFKTQHEVNIESEEKGAIFNDISINNKLECNFKSESEIYKIAFENKDVKTCDCFSDEQKKNGCKENINDSILYVRILSENDLEICEGIKNTEMKSACLNIGKAKMEYLEKIEKESYKQDNGDGVENSQEADIDLFSDDEN